MSRRNLLILTALNSALVLFLFALIFLHKPHRPDNPTNTELQSDDLHPASIETLKTADMEATSPQERIIILQSTPPSPALADFFQSILNKPSYSPSDPDTIKIQMLAFERWAWSVNDPSAILQQGSLIVQNPDLSLAQRDSALRASIARLDQLLSLKAPIDPEQLNQLLDFSPEEDSSCLSGTALLAGAFLHTRHPGSIEIQRLDDQVQALAHTPDLSEYNQSCVLEVITELQLTGMLAYARGHIISPNSDVVRIKAIQALGAIGTADELPLLNEQEADTPELFWAMINAKEKIQNRLRQPQPVAVH